MYPKSETVSLTTDSSGDAVGYTASAVRGRILSIAYVKPGSGGFDNGVDFTIVGEATGQTIWTESDVNASKVVSPRLATHTTAGVAALYAGGGAAVLGEHVWLAGERVKVTVASGGNAKAGSFIVTWAS